MYSSEVQLGTVPQGEPCSGISKDVWAHQIVAVYSSGSFDLVWGALYSVPSSPDTFSERGGLVIGDNCFAHNFDGGTDQNYAKCFWAALVSAGLDGYVTSISQDGVNVAKVSSCLATLAGYSTLQITDITKGTQIITTVSGCPPGYGQCTSPLTIAAGDMLRAQGAIYKCDGSTPWKHSELGQKSVYIHTGGCGGAATDMVIAQGTTYADNLGNAGFAIDFQASANFVASLQAGAYKSVYAQIQ
jgi:hypothetical protein